MRFLTIRTLILNLLFINSVVNCNILNDYNLTNIRDILELIKNDQQSNSLINEKIYSNSNSKYDNGICINQLINFVMALIGGQYWALQSNFFIWSWLIIIISSIYN